MEYHDSNGRFALGNPGKPKGSSKNKLREQIKEFLNTNWVNFPEWFGTLKNRDKIQIMLDLLPYCVSRLQSIEMAQDEDSGPMQGATIDYTKLSESTLREIISATTIEQNGDL